MGREDAERYANRHGDRRRDRHQQDVFAEQGGELLQMSDPETEDGGHLGAGVDRNGMAESTNCRTRGSADSKRSCGSAHQINWPSSMTAIRSPNDIASAMSCVTRITVLRRRP